MKKILLLGGSYFQIPSIIMAKKLGYYTVTCDYLPDNPGHKYADEYYNLSTTNKEDVLQLAKKLDIDGIVCYASDPSAPTAAYVAEKLDLPTNPYKSVNILSNKDLFRKFLYENNFNVPKAQGYNSIYETKKDIDKLNLPIMVKPVDSSGSKGVCKINNWADLDSAVINALQFSRCGRFILEEYVDKVGYQVAGDGFSVNGELVFRCFANEHFEKSGVNPYVPIGESWPYNMPKHIHDKIHTEIQRALTLLQMKSGAYNFDIRIDKDSKVYLMEIGPRNGGNLIPQVTKYATGIDMVEYTIKAAMGEDISNLTMKEIQGYWSNYMIHTSSPGILKEVKIDKQLIEKNIVEYDLHYKLGDKIGAFIGSNGTLGTMILKFGSMEEMLFKMDNMNKYINVVSK